MMQEHLFEPILDIVVEAMPRDNLLNSACIEFFDFIKREGIKTLIIHLVENYREKLKSITYVDTFTYMILRYDQLQGLVPNMETSFLDTEEDTPKRPETGRGNRWEGLKGLDAAEEEYFNTSDDEEETSARSAAARGSMNGASPKPLVDYPSDEETENMDTDTAAVTVPTEAKTDDSLAFKAIAKHKPLSSEISLTSIAPPERLSEKRRREEDDEDELGKLAQQKRRNSSSSMGSNKSSVLRRKKSFTNSAHGSGAGGKPNKIAISLSPAIKSGGESTGGDVNGS